MSFVVNSAKNVDCQTSVMFWVFCAEVRFSQSARIQEITCWEDEESGLEEPFLLAFAQ